MYQVLALHHLWHNLLLRPELHLQRPGMSLRHHSKAKWLTVLMSETIHEKPNVTNAMRMYLAAYATDQCFTDNVLQNTRTKDSHAIMCNTHTI